FPGVVRREHFNFDDVTVVFLRQQIFTADITGKVQHESLNLPEPASTAWRAAFAPSSRNTCQTIRRGGEQILRYISIRRRFRCSCQAESTNCNEISEKFLWANLAKNRDIFDKSAVLIGGRSAAPPLRLRLRASRLLSESRVGF